jgi:GGDEF domain-containing protein
MTGLPDQAAVLRKLDEVYPKLGRYSVVFFRIENIDPYLAKYGTGSHVEVIEWAAAILKTTLERYGGFVGTVGTHEFLAICRTSSCKKFVEEASEVFKRKAKSFYKPDDLKDGAVLSFATNGGKHVRLGLMGLRHCVADKAKRMSRDKFIAHLRKLCS